MISFGSQGFGRTRNRLLRLIPDNELLLLRSKSEAVQILPRQILHHWRSPMDHVYFIERGLVSVSARIDEDRFVEAWLIGSEGMIGAPLVLAEDDKAPPHRRVVQVGGTALRTSSREFLAALPELPTLRRVLFRYIDVVLLQTSQSGVCNAAHSLKQRLARWLLVARNALDDDNVPLTHDVLSQLLNVRRASVTDCLEVLDSEGAIRSSRGLVTIADAKLLQQTSCSCFSVIEREYQRQLSLESVDTHPVEARLAPDSECSR
ncbi:MULTISPECIES: Crp/Fnr family transcriptional regulator [unclassified Bradyrhizobium]|uniref:Crp/Fnr family transcriptional regulator n=1 Tax=unclassified Bradyrhizobium TaxID=2631580 RepID=UPI00247A2AC9|nr:MULTISPECIES: Crp/Fnr family transcriptional regulator [unclassified Bradyrhizobium]WGR68932.1 Crp/Fnr family transcriptional regulator [Bradyrhizobium sp. ISRA426]WGR80988.1 Crp/Fnr family transcriptional regulator [Bradyrhizobium sp. ISRA430]WGR84172.1 Crp/Fnr family transcriptional regulator [Bradyrhizobium sp. ISRA432]